MSIMCPNVMMHLCPACDTSSFSGKQCPEATHDKKSGVSISLAAMTMGINFPPGRPGFLYVYDHTTGRPYDFRPILIDTTEELPRDADPITFFR